MPAKSADNLTVVRKTGPHRGCRVDETEQRASLAAERLEAAACIAGWLAHRINNPLGSISGNAQLLERRLQRDIADPEALASYTRYLGAIRTEVERCASVISDVLSISRTGGPDLRAVDVETVLEESRELIRYAHPDSHVDIETRSVRGLKKVRADRDWLLRVLFEVISNAVQAGGGSVRVSARAGARYAEIAVSDSGPGIPEEIAGRLFDPFFSTKEGARGVGLTISLDLVRKMDGSLMIGRSSGAGTTAVIRVPVWGRQE